MTDASIDDDTTDATTTEGGAAADATDASGEATHDDAAGDEATGENQTGDRPTGDKEQGSSDGPFDLKGILRQFTAPMIESLDSRLREQVEAHVEELLTTKVDAAVADRLSTVDRAIADLSRSLAKLEDRLDAHDRREASSD